MSFVQKRTPPRDGDPSAGEVTQPSWSARMVTPSRSCQTAWCWQEGHEFGLKLAPRALGGRGWSRAARSASPASLRIKRAVSTAWGWSQVTSSSAYGWCHGRSPKTHVIPVPQELHG
jgi:hypothetical protein